MGALFNLSFDKFIAPTVAKIVYVLAMIGIVIGYLGFVAAGFNESAAQGLLILLIVGPILALLYLAFIRVAIEALLATILTAQNTGELVRLQGGRAPGQPAPGSQEPPPAPPAGPSAV